MNKTKLLKSNKGITLMVLIITLVIMLILLVTITVNVEGYAQRKRFTELETDITKLKEEVDLFYSENKELPIANKYTNIEGLSKIEVSGQKSVNDSENYYVIDLDLLEDMELNNGKDFQTIQDKSTEINDLMDIYIINEQSHIIYYPNGRYFNGEFWYTTLGTDINDIELIKTKATITFNSNGGTGTMENQTIMTERATAISVNEFTAQTGYEFDGWNTKSDGTGTSYLDNGNITLNDDVTLYAQWTPIVYTITYNLDGGTITGQKTTYTTEDEDFTLVTPSKQGYTFAGWTGDNGETAQTTVTITSGSIGNKTYKANWDEEKAYLLETGEVVFSNVSQSWKSQTNITFSKNFKSAPTMYVSDFRRCLGRISVYRKSK